ncbi:MAG: amidohydrolase [Planctomycetaceae bacterium]|nr:MAG: amidohydrolase [Planctomycetaceae bacterium]
MQKSRSSLFQGSRWLITWSLLCLSQESPNCRLTAEPPDLILHHGKIVTVDAQFRIVQALAIREGKIIAVGSNDDVLTLQGTGTKLWDLQGKTVIPGLGDSHVHPTGAAVYEFDHPIPEFETLADVLQYIAARTRVVPEGEWIVLNQVFITRLRDLRYPSRQELDQVAPRHPVMFRTGPDCALNSLALQRSGIDRNFQIPAGENGLIERDEHGEPTGLLRNATRFVKVQATQKTPTFEEQREQLRRLLADYNAVGLTAIADRSAGPTALRLYQDLLARDELTCRVFLSYGVNGQAPLEEGLRQIQTAADHPLHTYHPLLWLRGIKVFLDGGMLTGSAYMKEPWGISTIYGIRDPAYKGLLFIPEDKLEQLARYALERELQFTAHAVGDGAVETLAQVYARIHETRPLQAARPCITHCNFLSPEALAFMSRVGIVADLQPAWLWLDGKTLLQQFGNQRMRWFQPYRTMLDAGIVVGGGSDHMQKIGSLRSVNPYNPFLGMAILMQRLPRQTTQTLYPEECLTSEQALRLYTINNAYLMFEETRRGSLEVGKWADFVVLQEDLLHLPPEEWPRVTVVATYLAGQPVYQR